MLSVLDTTWVVQSYFMHKADQFSFQSVWTVGLPYYIDPISQQYNEDVVTFKANIKLSIH